jgi:hypothetical protein
MTFAQLIARFEASQNLNQQLSKSDLGIAGEEEIQDIEEARSEYESQVEAAEAQMRRNQKKRDKRRILAKVATVGSSFIPGVGKLASAAIGAGLDYAATSSVKPYDKYMENTLGEGMFYNQMRVDQQKDYDATNSFIQEAADSRNLANLIGAVSSGITQYSQFDTIKKFGLEAKDSFINFRDNKRMLKNLNMYEEGGFDSVTDPDAFINKYLQDINVEKLV